MTSMATTEISLRPIANDDRYYFAKWWRDPELIAVTSGSFMRLSDAQVTRYFQSMLHDKHAYNFMVIEQGRVVGHVALAAPSGGWREMTIVIGERDSRNLGIGTAALRRLITWCRRRDLTRIRLAVRPDNARAIRVYEKVGFRLGRLKHTPDNDNLPVVRLMTWRHE